MKNILIIVLAVLLIGLGAYLFMRTSSTPDVIINPEASAPAGSQDGQSAAESPEGDADGKSEVDEKTGESESIIGESVGGRTIMAYHYGSGNNEVVFVGGIHGGYSWNTAAVAYELMNYLETTPTAISANVRVTVIPVLNPDGLAKVVSTTGPFTRADVTGSDAVKVSGRFNANNVDLNRNFDCDWQSTGTWQNRSVSGGTSVFSEPESQAIRAYITEREPRAVVVWYSAAGGVFASNCHNGVLPETDVLTKLYAQASGYPAHQSFDFYTLTGDMVNWLAKSGIPGISVLLTDHENTEWTKNKAGIDAILGYYGQR